MNKTKKIIQESIAFAIDSISKDIQTDLDADRNLTRAECIRRLAEAYATVSK